jgi:3-oxoacyl-[acyl-carrier-protein] synthase II
MPNAPAFHISLMLGARGYNATICTACASGTQAISEATEVIRRGAADVVIAGGTECAITQTGIGGFGQMRALSLRNEDPEKASRPFDKMRDGLVLGEACGILVVESLEHARQRGANIYAEVVGSAVSADAFHVVQSDPSGAGAARAMRWALDNAHLVPEDIDYISAHATSTQVGDAAEVVAIKAVFGERAYSIPVSSLKSLIGHTIGAAGALEAIACVLSLRDQKVHPTINQEVPDPACDLDCVPNVARAIRVNTILSNSFGLGGQNACLILRKFQM